MKINYELYSFSFKEWIIYLFLGLSIDAIVSFLFYRSYVAFAIFLPAIAIFIRYVKKDLSKKRKKELTDQFREAIMAISASLGAGYSIENAFIEAANDLAALYGKDEMIIYEFQNMIGRMASNETLESILQDFADRSGIDDIQDFVDVFVTAKKSGGDMVSIIRKSVDHIGEKIDVLNLSTRAYNALTNAKIYTIKELLKKSIEDNKQKDKNEFFVGFDQFYNKILIKSALDLTKKWVEINEYNVENERNFAEI